MREDGLAVDKIILTTDSQYVPEGDGLENTDGLSIVVNGSAPESSAPDDELDTTENTSEDENTETENEPGNGSGGEPGAEPGDESNNNGSGNDDASTTPDSTDDEADSDSQETSVRQVVYRVNAGGEALAGDWISDSSANTYVTSGRTSKRSNSIARAAVDSYVPLALFQSERWHAGTQHWQFL